MENRYFKIIDLFIKNDDIARNNANFVRGIPVLEHVVLGEVMKDYLFDRIYKGLPVRIHHEEGWAYHHQAYKLSYYCVGLSAKDVAFWGLKSNAKNERTAAPPKRLETLFMQCANLICLIAQEVSGATSLNDLSTVAAGYLYHLERSGIKKYSAYELENLWQEFLYNVNLPFRSGNSPFSNITLDFGKPNSRLKDEPVIYAGKALDYTYSEIPSEYFDRVNFAFLEAMGKGDELGNPFTFPLITVNVTEDFDWNNPAWKELLKKSEFFGGFYIQNYLKNLLRRTVNIKGKILL
jgi:ribonucleoside-triphosphate reductase